MSFIFHNYNRVKCLKNIVVFSENAAKESQEPEERCDIIKFYNLVYVQKVQNFVRKFANGNAQVSTTGVGSVDLESFSPLFIQSAVLNDQSKYSCVREKAYPLLFYSNVVAGTCYRT